MRVLGVDIGARGSVALVNAATGELVEVHDMVLADGPKGRAAVNPALLADLVHRAHAAHAFVELIGARLARGLPGRLREAGVGGRRRGVGDVGVPAIASDASRVEGRGSFRSNTTLAVESGRSMRSSGMPSYARFLSNADE
jgi:hypothetical protein